MLRPASYSRHPDWFAIDSETAKPLFFQIGESTIPVPGLKTDPKSLGLLVHRSHLPLVNTTEALVAIAPTSHFDWEVRDRRIAPYKLRTTQQQALDFIAPRRGVLLGDDMRLGKTLACIMAHDPARGPLVIVGPLSTRAVWLGWLRKVFPDVPVAVLTGKKFDPAKLKFPIIWGHYEIITQWQALFRIGTLVLDEAHALINRKAKRSFATALLASRAEKVIAATGTPIWNMPANLWNVIGMLAPGAWGSYFDFGYRYGLPVQTGYGIEFTGISNGDESARSALGGDDPTRMA